MKHRPNVRHNVLANFAGKAGTAFLNIAFVPVWMRQMGVEAYGLVGAFSSLVVFLSVLDLGLSTTLNRELARHSTSGPGSDRTRSLVRTFESVFWGIGILAGIAVAMWGPSTAKSWLHAERLSPETLSQAVRLMGLIIIFQWPSTLYSAGLQGTQRHVAMNVAMFTGTFLRTAGGAAVLWLIAPTIQVFFLWQVAVSGVQTLLLARALWKSLPDSNSRPTFRAALLTNTMRFSGGVAVITLMVAMLTQVDRVIVSRFLSLEMLGYYSFAAAIGVGLNALSIPVSSALFPRLTQLVASQSQDQLIRVYHFTCQLVALLVLPLSICVALFSRELLSMWLRDAVMVDNTYFLVSLLAVGTALNSIMAIPYHLQLAHGWTALSVYKNILAVAIIPAITVVLVRHYGAVGAAIGWIVLNAGYVLFEIPVMHRRLLTGEMWRWYALDMALPLIVAAAPLVLVRLFIPSGSTGIWTAVLIAATYALTFLAVLISLPAIRDGLKGRLRIISPDNAATHVAGGTDPWRS